jgi:glycosyltransferase involved in cell wall biosynthesis
MTVSVVQLTHNNRGQVRACLPSVARLVERPEVAEWIVLDNGSTDGTAEDLEAIAHNCPKLRLILRRENLGCGGGRNVLWREAAGELVMSMDSDVTVEGPERLADMIRDLERPGVGIVGEHGGWVRRDWSWTEEAPAGYVGLVPIVCGFCQLFPRSFVDQWTQREEYGPYWLDDSEFSLQVQEAHDVSGWVGRYGMRHQWSHTNGRQEAVRRAAWAAFRGRWRPAGLAVHRAEGAAKRSR